MRARQVRRLPPGCLRRLPSCQARGPSPLNTPQVRYPAKIAKGVFCIGYFLPGKDVCSASEVQKAMADQR